MLYKRAAQVKDTAEKLPLIVDKLEQKRKIHDTAAHIMVTLDKLARQ